MNSSYVRFLLVSLLLVAVQVWVLNPVELFGLVTPLIYCFALILLPIGAGPSLVTLLGFLIGGAIDILGLTPGIHAAAFTLTAFVRQPLLGLLTDRNTPETALPSYSTLRGGSVVLLSLLVAVHHLALYLLVALSHPSLYLLVSMLASYAASWVLCLLCLLLLGVEPSPRSK